jgi:polar amino acid transport system substrate-binding protein
MWRLGIALCCFQLLVFAQPLPDVPREFLQDRRRLAGDHIAFCINPQGLLASFERELAAELASVLLLEYSFAPEVRHIAPPLPLDYRFPITYDELLIYLTDHCAAFMGFSLAGGSYPNWLTFTRAYLRTPFVLAVTNSSYRRLSDIPRHLPIGARSGSEGDIRLMSYILSLPPEQRWRRFPYRDHELLIERLQAGEVEEALLWEPALYAATEGNPERYGIHIILTDPLPQPEIQFGITLRSRETFLRTMLDDAIVALIEDGTIEQLLQKHDLPGRPGSLGR